MRINPIYRALAWLRARTETNAGFSERRAVAWLVNVNRKATRTLTLLRNTYGDSLSCIQLALSIQHGEQMARRARSYGLKFTQESILKRPRLRRATPWSPADTTPLPQQPASPPAVHPDRHAAEPGRFAPVPAGHPFTDRSEP